jgi:hypothetical protein
MYIEAVHSRISLFLGGIGLVGCLVGCSVGWWLLGSLVSYLVIKLQTSEREQFSSIRQTRL